MTRLNKFITDSGYCSRREADNYISQGRVTINGRDAQIADSVVEGDVVEVDGEKVGRKAKRYVYIAFNKPVGVTCTTDRNDKTNIIDFINYKERIFPVGRLDKDSNGLIILTNNGDIVNKILRAGNNHRKEYLVTVDKPITPQFIAGMTGGVRIMGVKTKPCEVIKRSPTTFTIYLTQGLNRQIRRMCSVLGYTVIALKRVRIMNITLGSLDVGKWRYFTPQEVTDMMSMLERSSGTADAVETPPITRRVTAQNNRKPTPELKRDNPGKTKHHNDKSNDKPKRGDLKSAKPQVDKLKRVGGLKSAKPKNDRPNRGDFKDDKSTTKPTRKYTDYRRGSRGGGR